MKDAKAKKHVEFLEYLYDRWQDERGYEDFAIYKLAAEKHFKRKLVKMTAKPFVVDFGDVVYRVSNTRVTIKEIS